MDRDRSHGAWMREFVLPSSELPADSDCLTEFLDWLWSFGLHQRPEPSAFIGVWGGDGVPTLVEMAIVAMGATERRRFCLYISQSEKLAQERIRNIKRIFQWSHKLAKAYPRLVEPARSGNGQVRNWNQRRLHCASGFIVEGASLKQAQHTSNVGGVRPDLMIFDNNRVTSRNAHQVARLLGSAVAGGERNTGFAVLGSRGERSLPEALTNGLLSGFFADRMVGRCD